MIILFPRVYPKACAEIFSLSGMKRNYSQILDLKSTEYLTYYFKRPEMYKIENLKLKKLTKINIYNQYQLIV